MSSVDASETAEYIPSPYGTVGRTWAMLCAPLNSIDSAEDVDVIFATLSILCGSNLAHLSENVPASSWYRLLRIAGQPEHSAASNAVAHMAWWGFIAAGGVPGIADTFVVIPDPIDRRRLLESVEMWQREADGDHAKSAYLLERHLLSVAAEEFQLRKFTITDESCAEWINILSNFSEIADTVMRSDVRNDYLRQLYATSAGVLS